MLLAVSEITREVNRAFWLIGGTCVLLLVGITIAMVIFVVRYRRTRRPTTDQTEGHTFLEITWTVIPTIIVTWMFFVGYQGFELMRKTPENAMAINVTGKQWAWAFEYPDAGISTTEMVVPVNTPIKLELTSPPDDVVHSFYIPDFRVKEDCLPGTTTHMWFEAEREGAFNIFCAEFCGKDHSKMISMLRVVSAKDYDQWIRAQEAKKYRPVVFEAVQDPENPGFAELSIDANALYGTFCASCHGPAGDGSGLPDLARSFQSTDDWKKSPKTVDIYRTLIQGIEGTQMRGYPNFTPWERIALAHHVRAFLKGKAPEDTKADYDALVAEYGLDKIQKPKESIPIDRAMELVIKEAKDRNAKKGAAVP